MRGERLRPEGIERNGEVQLAARVAGYGLRRRRIRVLAPSEEGVDELLQRTELVTELLRQRLGEPRDLLAREPRNEPVAPHCIDLVQCDKRHGERHAVARRAGLVMVIEREASSRHLEPMRKL